MQALKESSVFGQILREFMSNHPKATVVTPMDAQHALHGASSRDVWRARLRLPSRTRLALTLLTALALSVPALTAHAYDPLEFVPQQIPEARLSGEGTLRRYGEPVYSARLFIDPGTFSPEDLSRESFALDFEYATSCSGAHVANQVKVEMRDMGIASNTQINSWTIQLSKFLPALKSDDHLTAVFWPGRGTGFFLNGELYGEIPGDAFARAYFGIWLDETSTIPSLRHALLSGAG